MGVSAARRTQSTRPPTPGPARTGPATPYRTAKGCSTDGDDPYRLVSVYRKLVHPAEQRPDCHGPLGVVYSHIEGVKLGGHGLPIGSQYSSPSPALPTARVYCTSVDGGA
ncbi:TPA: hypothetical protein EYN65_03215 [Candidatus Poribacteria bacterium]|nr:hypothetical protein [Candidatus Poribacteria bacterium]HIC03591.1 hypothetical protein [Candidatus Poribacteria bacterium]